jgi:hypothetical protein
MQSNGYCIMIRSPTTLAHVTYLDVIGFHRNILHLGVVNVRARGIFRSDLFEVRIAWSKIGVSSVFLERGVKRVHYLIDYQ